jgi:hypothetical protein
MMYGDDSHSDIEKYVTDDELEFAWEFPFQGSLEMKVRINKGEFKSRSKSWDRDKLPFGVSL